MKESMWGYAIIVLGILAVGIIWFFGNVTKTDQHDYNLLKETTEAAMLDAVDLAAYRKDGSVRIEEEKFVENFIRRFAENADLSNTYKIQIYDVNEEPPKVSLKISTPQKTNATGEIIEFNIVNNIDAILETKYKSPDLKIYISNSGTDSSSDCTSNSDICTHVFSHTLDLKIGDIQNAYYIKSVTDESILYEYCDRQSEIYSEGVNPKVCETLTENLKNGVDDYIAEIINVQVQINGNELIWTVDYKKNEKRYNHIPFIYGVEFK